MKPTFDDKLAPTILKMEYRRDYFDIVQMKSGAKEVVTIEVDGTVCFKSYNAGSRKAHTVKRCHIPSTIYMELCNAIELCIATADRQDFYVDDSSEELKLFHKYGRVQIIDRGLGNENTHIGAIMNEFIASILPDEP